MDCFDSILAYTNMHTIFNETFKLFSLCFPSIMYICSFSIGLNIGFKF